MSRLPGADSEPDASRRDPRAVLAPGARWHRARDARHRRRRGRPRRRRAGRASSAWHRAAPPRTPGGPRSRSGRCRCPGSPSTTPGSGSAAPSSSGRRARSTWCTPPPHVASASRAPWVATIHDLHFLHEPGHFTHAGRVGVHALPRPRAGRGGPGACARRRPPGSTARPPASRPSAVRVVPWARLVATGDRRPPWSG